jgi:hypothetical protein
VDGSLPYLEGGKVRIALKIHGPNTEDGVRRLEWGGGWNEEEDGVTFYFTVLWHSSSRDSDWDTKQVNNHWPTQVLPHPRFRQRLYPLKTNPHDRRGNIATNSGFTRPQNSVMHGKTNDLIICLEAWIWLIDFIFFSRLIGENVTFWDFFFSPKASASEDHRSLRFVTCLKPCMHDLATINCHHYRSNSCNHPTFYRPILTVTLTFLYNRGSEFSTLTEKRFKSRRSRHKPGDIKLWPAYRPFIVIPCQVITWYRKTQSVKDKFIWQCV